MARRFYSRRTVCAAILFTLAFANACSSCEERDARRESRALPAPEPGEGEPGGAAEPAEEPLTPLPPSVNVHDQKVLLGRRLYHDKNLSADGTVACVSCHAFDHGGAEPRPTSLGIRDQEGPINSPTVLNAAYNFRQFWDGRAADLQEQAAGPVENPLEMGETWDNVVVKLSNDPNYVELFAAIYNDGITKENATDAIAEFEKSLITPSRFDDFLRGNENAITTEERQGYETFKSVGCTACHTGINVGGTMYQKMGLVRPYFQQIGRELTDADMGRFNVTHQESDRHFFKVPGLRNIAETGPYLHDGSQTTLEGTVQIMGQFQLGRDLTEVQVTQIVDFLKSLSGRIPPHATPPPGATPEGATRGE